MLILTRKPGESLYIGDNVKITIVEIKGHQIRVGIDAPAELRIYREEIYLQIMEENKKAAAEAAGLSDKGLEGLSTAWVGRKHTEGDDRPRKGIASLGSTPQSQGSNPQVIVKRKKKKLDGEED